MRPTNGPRCQCTPLPLEAGKDVGVRPGAIASQARNWIAARWQQPDRPRRSRAIALVRHGTLHCRIRTPRFAEALARRATASCWERTVPERAGSLEIGRSACEDHVVVTSSSELPLAALLAPSALMSPAGETRLVSTRGGHRPRFYVWSVRARRPRSVSVLRCSARCYVNGRASLGKNASKRSMASPNLSSSSVVMPAMSWKRHSAIVWPSPG